MVEIAWQDPPARSSTRGTNYGPFIDELKKNPGKWGRITTEWKTSSAPAAFRQKGCETTTRRNKDKKTWTVFARYPLPEPRQKPAAQQAVEQAVKKGTALVPPANDFGLKRFQEQRAARGVPAEGRH